VIHKYQADHGDLKKDDAGMGDDFRNLVAFLCILAAGRRDLGSGVLGADCQRGVLEVYVWRDGPSLLCSGTTILVRADCHSNSPSSIQ
jgi:hypothetical protein